MADEKPAPESPWAPLLVIMAVIGASFVALYLRGDLKNLNAKSLFEAPPAQQSNTPVQSGSGYAPSVYSTDGEPVDITNQP